MNKKNKVMTKTQIKNNLKKTLVWNYEYYNVIDETGKIVASYDIIDEAKKYVKWNKHINLFIQNCHNISQIL